MGLNVYIFATYVLNSLLGDKHGLMKFRKEEGQNIKK